MQSAVSRKRKSHHNFTLRDAFSVCNPTRSSKDARTITVIIGYGIVEPDGRLACLSVHHMEISAAGGHSIVSQAAG